VQALAYVIANGTLPIYPLQKLAVGTGGSQWEVLREVEEVGHWDGEVTWEDSLSKHQTSGIAGSLQTHLCGIWVKYQVIMMRRGPALQSRCTMLALLAAHVCCIKRGCVFECRDCNQNVHDLLKLQ
jgi:hypothetical protein